MDTQDLIGKLKNRDAEAFRELMRSYGKTLYPKLLDRLGSKELVDEAFRRTMLRFYDTVTGTKGNDPLEILLLSCADQAETELLTEAMDDVLDELSGKTPLPRSTPAPAPPAVRTMRDAAEPPKAPAAASRALPSTSDQTSPVQEPPTAPKMASPYAPAVYEREETEEKPERKKRSKKPASYAPLILLTILALLLAWVVAGEMIHTELLPYADLGYESFREFCIQLFNQMTQYIA